MGTKITIIGAGSVGSTIANDLVAMNIATEILLIDINEQKAFGEAMDIYQGTGFTSPAIVRSGHYEDAVGSSIVIITSGLARKPGQTRLELAQTNVDILKQITPNIVKYAPDAIYIIVSNPVDIMTYAFHRLSGIPAERIIGSGTALTVSTMMNGEYGISDVCLSVLCIVDSKGVRGKIQNDLTDEELQKLRRSADKLKETIAAINI